MSFPSNANWVPPPAYANAFAKELGRVHCKVGKLRVSGSSITKDEEEGVAWLRSAAVSGDGEFGCGSQCFRPILHGPGALCVREPSAESFFIPHRAICLHGRAADAQFELGRCHDEGRGVEQDIISAGHRLLRDVLQGAGSKKPCVYIYMSAACSAELMCSLCHEWCRSQMVRGSCTKSSSSSGLHARLLLCKGPRSAEMRGTFVPRWIAVAFNLPASLVPPNVCHGRPRPARG